MLPTRIIIDEERPIFDEIDTRRKRIVINGIDDGPPHSNREILQDISSALNTALRSLHRKDGYKIYRHAMLDAAAHAVRALELAGVDLHKAYSQIKSERVKQDIRWGGIEHDCTHPPLEWIRLSREYYQRAPLCSLLSSDAFTYRVTQIAAFAVAAVRTLDCSISMEEWNENATRSNIPGPDGLTFPHNVLKYIQDHENPSWAIINFPDEVISFYYPTEPTEVAGCWRLFFSSEDDSRWHQVLNDPPYLQLDWVIKAMYDNGLPVESMPMAINDWGE